jgi:hypothetical protein
MYLRTGTETRRQREKDVKKALAAAAIGCALLCVASAGASTAGGGGKKSRHAKQATISLADAPPINWGVADDMSKYADDGGTWFYGQLAGANLTENRWTLAWNPSNPTAITELPFLTRAAPKAQAAGVHVVLALYAGTDGTSAPDGKDHDATAFCNWAATVASTVAAWGIHDFIVWNEPNTALYWAPQKDASGNDVAAAPFEALLAQCYDAIHAADPNANVIGMGLSPRASQPKTSNEPLTFLRDVGAAYRASGRTAPIMDQLALHPYPFPAQTGSPDKSYPKADDFGPPDLARVKQAVYDAFNGTGQPTTMNGLTFRIDELGWQTDTTQYPQYTGAENGKPPGLPNPVDEQTQAAYLNTAATTYLACDPTVTDVELFLLVDEAARTGWQSGLMTAGGEGVSTPKVAYAASAPLFAAGRSACTAGPISWSPGSIVPARSTNASHSSNAALKKAVARCNKKFKGKKNKAKRKQCVANAKKKH